MSTHRLRDWTVDQRKIMFIKAGGVGESES